MKIVTYNVNGLRQRISQFGSLLKLLDSFDADIICFQETKLRRPEITADLAMAEGYESFFSCTRTNERGRTGYSGVATFCRVKSSFSSHEVALPVTAEEGFTGLVGNSSVAVGLEEFERDDLLKVDNEGRCVITDHAHFVIFNVYGPRADPDDADRVQFKLKFYKVLEKRWEYMQRQGKRIFLVGDLNIAPAAIDRCDAGPEFEKNEFRTWLRSTLVESGGTFFDVFRAKHPDRREAYTCWPSNSGAEQFNYGSRIDHILFSGPCLHQDQDQGHNFMTCHVIECDIMTQYKRFNHGDAPKWKGGWNVKLEGSDHAPVYASLDEIPDVPQHSTPSLSSRYLPVIHGLQQTLVSMLKKRQATTEHDKSLDQRLLYNCSSSCSVTGLAIVERNEDSIGNADSTAGISVSIRSEIQSKKKQKTNSSSQLSMRSFFKQIPIVRNDDTANQQPNELDLKQHESEPSLVTQDENKYESPCLEEGKTNSAALVEWQRIREVMQNSIPLCKGHKEQCVARVVKKPGPTLGRRFYVCARAEGPASNPEANCGFFKWASSKQVKNRK